MAISATTAALLAVGSFAVQAVGSVVQGAAQRDLAQAQATVTQMQAEQQAEVRRQQADRERVVAAQIESDFRRRQNRAMAQVRAAAGARGIDVGVGSPLLTSEDFAAETETQALRIREGGHVSATRLEQQADLTRGAGIAEAGLLRASGRSAFTAGIIGAGGSLLRAAGALPRRSVIFDEGEG